MMSRQSWVPPAFLLAAVVAACSDSSRRQPISPDPAGPPPVLGLELSGPGTVHLGQSVQFTVTGRQSDGTTRDVTRDVTWRFDTELLSMSTPGLVTGKSKGQGAISVSFSRLGATIGEVVVVPEGTFRLSGTVRDSGVLVDAIVRVENEALGQAEIPAPGGEYVVFGVAGDTTVTAIKDGYQQTSVTQVIKGHQKVDLDVLPRQPRRDISGRYTLAITTGAPCIGLPEEFRSRSYSALIEQSGAALIVTLSGPQFVVHETRTLNRFTGFVEASAAVFRLTPFTVPDPNYYYVSALPDVLEVLPGNRYYGFDGTVVAPLGSATLPGVLNGNIAMFTSASSWPSQRCASPGHRFVFTKETI